MLNCKSCSANAPLLNLIQTSLQEAVDFAYTAPAVHCINRWIKSSACGACQTKEFAIRKSLTCNCRASSILQLRINSKSIWKAAYRVQPDDASFWRDHCSLSNETVRVRASGERASTIEAQHLTVWQPYGNRSAAYQPDIEKVKRFAISNRLPGTGR